MAIKIKAPQEVADINVTPMVDVMLVLLIIFMVITPMLQSKVSVDLAKAQNPRLMPDEKKTDAVVISITRDGKFYLGSSVIALDSISKQVGDLMANKLDKTVYIKCDNRAKLGDVLSVEDAIRGAGIEQMGLITEKVDRRPPLPPAYTP